MGGGLLQLVLSGQQDQYITQNPQISYFKYAYKRHTNFSMESIPLSFATSPSLIPEGEDYFYRCDIKRYGDLLSNLYFCFTLPEIYSSDTYKFRWIKDIGNIFIKKATITVGGVVIDSIVGEWLSIWNELTLKDNSSYNRLIGNIPELTSPTIQAPRIGIKNNKFYYTFYPFSAKNKGENPSIQSKTLYVPLNFWFTRNPALALPLLKLQLADIYITIYTKGSENLYQVYSTIADMYVSPEYYNILHNDNIDIKTFTNTYSLNPYIDANYIFLGNIERENILKMTNFTDNNKNGMQYTIEQINVSTEKSVSSKSTSKIDIDMNIHRHTKEILWTIKRDDYKKFNIYNNYTSALTYNESCKIMKSASIIWNKTNTRIEKDADYFSYIQPYQHHTNVPKVGIYCYSFALFPEKVNPTGSFNGSVINTILRLEIDGKYNNKVINDRLTYYNKEPYEFNYLITTYTITMNIFEMIGGTAGLKFA